MVIIENMRLALEIELGQGQRPAFDLAGIEPRQCLKVAFVGNPDPAKETIVPVPVRVLQNRGQGLARQAPPLAAHMRHQPFGHLAMQAQRTLQLNICVEQEPLFLPRKRESQRKAFMLQPAHGPWHIGCCRALDEIRARSLSKIFLQFLNRSQRQARPGCQVDVMHVFKGLKQQPGGRLRPCNDPPCSPFTPVPLAEPDQRVVRQGGPERVEPSVRHLPVNVQNHRASRGRPVPGHLLGPSQRRVNQHDDPDRHAQFPLDIRPRISSCRQLIYFSLHSFHGPSPLSSLFR